MKQEQKLPHQNDGEGVKSIAENSLACIESVGLSAEKDLRSYRAPSIDALMPTNTLNNPNQAKNIGAVGRFALEQLEALAKEPVIARVCFEDEEGDEHVLFISRSSPPSTRTDHQIASYRSPKGRLASLPPGSEFEIPLDGRNQYVELKSSAILHPRRLQDQWDAVDTEIREIGRQTSIASLRALLLETVAPAPLRDLVAEMLEEDEPNVRDGIRKSVLTHMGFRDQPILDQFQDELFRLPINNQCFLSGPPGTGKTTTLIKRLGQKLDPSALDSVEARLAGERLVDHAPEHQHSWIMFSPTELLRLYVRDAFSEEGVPARPEDIQTWDDYRNFLGRDVLSLLRTSSGSGAFVFRADANHLQPSCYRDGARAWYEAFTEYFADSITKFFRDDAEALAKSRNGISSGIGEELLKVLDRNRGQPVARLAPEFAELGDGIKDAVADVNRSVEAGLNLALNTLLHSDRGFLDEFGAAASTILAARDHSATDADEHASEEDDEHEEEELPLSGRRLTRREAIDRYYRVVRSAGTAAAQGRKVAPRSINGQLLAWLGSERVPERKALIEIGVNALEAARLRRFSAVHATILRRIPFYYRAFRRAQDATWYSGLPQRPNDIAGPELDLLILLTLRTVTQVWGAYRRASGVDMPQGGAFGRMLATYKNQVLVDEASDFSILQLAAMYELSNPTMRSFFACGDLNQRLTSWGITSDDDFDWIAPSIKRRRIEISYRQTQKLVQLAKDVARLDGADATEIVLPDRVEQEGYDPIWATELDDYEKVSSWIVERIREIETDVRMLPTIAILVHDEKSVALVAEALTARLADMNLKAVACERGEKVGSERDIRVFSIQHIKGMEFEAVFFVDMDKIIMAFPELYPKYLYVGATRAATYLGATFTGEIPAELQGLEKRFSASWTF